MTPLRIIFMGTPVLAATVLEAVLGEGDFRIAVAVTQPDQPKGRQMKLQPSAVKELALARGLPVLQPPHAKDPEFIEQIRVLEPDLIVVAAFGQILPQALLDVPKFGCLNVHTSLLPKYRGAAPIQWAVLNGDLETGVTIMKMDSGLDTGGILSEERTPIVPGDDALTVHDRLAKLSGGLLVRTIPEYISGKLTPRPQPQGATYARKIKKEDGKLDWSLPAQTLRNRVRGLKPWPGTYTFLQRSTNQLLLKILRAEVASQGAGAPGEIVSAARDGIVVACGEGALRIIELQREGGKPLPAHQFLSGCPINSGERLA